MKIKKFLSIAMIIAMIMALCPLVALAQVPEGYEIYVSSFSVKPVSPGVVKAVFNTKSGNLTSGVWTIEYDFMRRTAANCNIAVLGNNPGIGAFFAINPTVVGGAPYTWYGTGGGEGPIPITKDGTNVAEPAVGEWHSVKMVVDLDSGTYTSYYDDADPNERPFTYEYIASLEFGVDSGAFDVRNLRLYQGEPADGSMIDAVYPINVQSAVLNSGASASAEYTFMPTTPITSGKWVLETEFKMSGAEGGNFAILHDMGDGTIEQTRFGFSGGAAYVVIPGEGPDVIPDYAGPEMNTFHTMIFEVDLDNKTFHFDIDGHTKDKTYEGTNILGFLFCAAGTSTTTVNYLSLHEPIGEITPPEASNAVIVGNPVIGQPLTAIYDYEGFECDEGNSKVEWLASDEADGVYNVVFSGQNFGLNSFMGDKFVKARVTPKNMFNVPGEPTESLPVKVKSGLNTPVIQLDFETPHTQGELLADGYNNTLLDGNEGPWNSGNTFCTQDGCLVVDRAVDEGQTRLDRPLPVTGGKILFAVNFHSTCPEFIFEISTPVAIFTSATIRQDSITVLQGRGGAAPGTYQIPKNEDNNLLLFEIDTEANSFSCSYNGVTCFTGAELYLPAEGLNGFYVNPKGTGTLYIEDVTISRVSEAQPETGVEVTELTMDGGKAVAFISNYTQMDLTPSVFAVDLSQAPYEIKMASAMVPSLYNNVMLETETLSSGQGKAIALNNMRTMCQGGALENVQVDYDFNEKSVYVTADAAQGETAVMITNTKDLDSITDANYQDHLFALDTTMEARVDMTFDASLPEGGYYVVLTQGDAVVSKPFTIIGEQAILDVLDAVNSGDSSMLVDFVTSEDVKADYPAVKDAVNADMVRTGPYTDLTLACQNVTEFTAMEMFNAAGSSQIGGLVTKYGNYMSFKKADYAALADDMNRIFPANVAEAKMTAIGDLKKTSRKVHAIARFNNTAANELEALVLENNDIFKLDLDGDYKNYSPVQVFSPLAAQDYNTAAEIQKAFNDRLKKLKDKSGTDTDNDNGGSVSTVKKNKDSQTVVVISNEPPVSTQAPKECPYKDVPKNHFAYDAICRLAEEKIISGYGGDFHPDGTITREEFLKMVVLATGGVQADATAPFEDVASDAWYYSYIATAFAQGITNGTGDGSFGVGTAISRQDACVMLARAAAFHPIRDYVPFADEADIAPYAVAAIQNAFAAGLINGYPDGAFAPKAFISRAEAAMIIHKLL